MMTNTNTTAADLVACNKCDGSGYIRAFGHIAGGRCFACGGAGKVEARAPRREAVKATVKGKMIEVVLGGVACDVFIVRFGGGFRADVTVQGQGRDGDLGCVWFDVISGQVVNAKLSNGLLCRSQGERGDGWLTEREVERALTGACKA
tara:strand:- start:695 stop:1138 length:444 start_codon:yes stop_codon:yes gene_type:complete